MVSRKPDAMKPRRFLKLAPACVLLAALLSVVPAGAQNASLAGLVEKSGAAMEAENWQAALDLNSEAVTRFGKKNPLKAYGAQFGAIYYRKGVCEMKLKRWSEAMTSFEICYRDFPNETVAAESGNIFQKMALLKWGEAAMGAEKWELALSRFRKFIDERDKTRDRFPQGSFYINMAVCHYQLGHIPEGNESLEISIRNKDGFPTPEPGIIAGFQALVTAAILKHNEQALLDFIGKNRGDLVAGPAVMHRYSRVFLKLAGDAVAADMQRAAIALYQFVPSTEEALDDTRALLKAVSDPQEKKALEQGLAELEAESAGKNSPESIRLAAMAFLHEKNGNVRGAFAAYQELETFHTDSQNREANLFNLVRTASLVAGSGITRGFAETFIKDFPDSQRVPELREMMQEDPEP